jgi:hypothetical protein
MISVEEFVERICLIGAARGPRRFPRKRRDRQIMIKTILMRLDSSATYTEPEINKILEIWNREDAPEITTDYVTVRRLLIDHGHLERTADGSSYRVGFPPASVAFDLEIDEIDVRATIAAYRDHAKRKPPRKPVSEPTSE